MVDSTKMLLNLICEGKTINEISSIMGLTNKQLFFRLSLLKNKGFYFSREYYDNGNIKYHNIKSIVDNIKDNSINILSDSYHNTFKILAISDLHIGSALSDIKLIENVYDYCVKNDIHIILNCGDLIDGTFGKFEKTIENGYSQIDYMIKKYPFDKNILNFVCLGNHDESVISHEGQDIRIALENARHDIVAIGYGTAKVNIKNDQIILKHPGTTNYTSDLNYEKSLILNGHKHYFKIINTNSNFIINLPSLSNLLIDDNSYVPSALFIELTFNNGYYVSGIFSQLLFNEGKVFAINKIEENLSKDKIIDNKKFISNQYEGVKELKKVDRIAQFNNKYSR